MASQVRLSSKDFELAWLFWAPMAPEYMGRYLKSEELKNALRRTMVEGVACERVFDESRLNIGKAKFQQFRYDLERELFGRFGP